MSQAVVTNQLREARRLLGEGRHRRAATAASDWLKEHPDDPEAYHLLGACYGAVGQTAASATALGRAVTLEPESSDRRAAFAVATGVFGDMERARRELATARELDPASTFGALEFGFLCLCRETGEEAARHFERLLETTPGDQRPRVGLVLANAATGNVDLCRSRFQALAEEDPGVHFLPGLLCLELERALRFDDSLKLMRLALVAGAEDPELPYRIAAAEGGGPSRAPDSYVETHFDRFAETFDEVLRDRLQYRTPELIVEAALRQTRVRHGAVVLDGGCGTGLCGPLLRPVAQRLIGVDLSSSMLDRARHCGVYDELEQAELVSALERRRGTLDLIVCADVLVYLGNLEDFFEAATAALRPRGVLAVSVERLPDECAERYRLQRSGRFAHSSAYVREVTDRAGLEQLEADECELRLERGAWVEGLIAVHRRPPS